MLAGTVFRLVVKNAPKIGVALQAVNVFLKANPAISTWARERLTAVPKQVAAVQKRHGDAAKIRGMLDIVREVAGELEAHASDAAGPVVAAPWVQRADDIERGVRLAEKQSPPERRKSFARLKEQADALLAELLEATTRVQTVPAPGATAASQDESAEPDLDRAAPDPG
jgi:hypothetical protein